MSIEQQETTKGITLKIIGSFSIYEAAAGREALLQGLSAHDDVTVDLEGVEECDVAGVQLLCAAGKTAAEMGKGFRVTAAPPSVVRVMDEMGMHSIEWRHPTPEAG